MRTMHSIVEYNIAEHTGRVRRICPARAALTLRNLIGSICRARPTHHTVLLRGAYFTIRARLLVPRANTAQAAAAAAAARAARKVNTNLTRPVLRSRRAVECARHLSRLYSITEKC